MATDNLRIDSVFKFFVNVILIFLCDHKYVAFGSFD